MISIILFALFGCIAFVVANRMPNPIFQVLVIIAGYLAPYLILTPIGTGLLIAALAYIVGMLVMFLVRV